MAEILIASRGEPRAKALVAALNAKGLSATEAQLDSPARLPLAQHDPAFVITIFVPGDAEEDQEVVGQWVNGERAHLIWVLAADEEVDLVIESRLPKIKTLAVFSASNSPAEIATLLAKHVRPSRSSRKTRGVFRRGHGAAVVAVARRMSATIFDLIPAIAINLDTVGIYDGSATGALRLLEQALARSRLVATAWDRVRALKDLIADAHGTDKNRVRRLAAGVEARLVRALESVKFRIVRDAAAGDERAAESLVRELGLDGLRARCRRWARAQAHKGDDLKALDARGDLALLEVIKRAASRATSNATSKADVVGLLVAEAAREVRALEGDRTRRGRGASLREQRDTEGADSIINTIRTINIENVAYYPLADAAQAAHTALKTVYRWIGSGELAVHREEGYPTLLDRSGIEALRRLKETKASRMRRTDANDGMLSISNILGDITRRDGAKFYDKWSKMVVRVARDLRLPDRRDRRGGHRFTPAEADQVRAALRTRLRSTAAPDE